MIKKAALPDRRCPRQRNMFRESLFQHSYPWPKLKIVGSAEEKMDVIGHHHVLADGDVASPVGVLGEPDECRVHRIGREQFPPFVCTKCDEKQGVTRRSIASAAGVLEIRARESCSRFPVGSAMQISLACTSRRPQGDGYSWNLSRKKHAQRRLLWRIFF